MAKVNSHTFGSKKSTERRRKRKDQGASVQGQGEQVKSKSGGEQVKGDC